jgi:hypothetical protein
MRQEDRDAVAEFQRALTEVEGVQEAERLTSTLVMKHVVKDRPLPA